MLTDEEISELDTKYKKFGADFKVAFPGKAQTPKGHWLERHVGGIAKRFGTVGKFGCDGGEATHSQKIATLCRSIVIPGARLRPPNACLRQGSEPRRARALKTSV